MSGFSLHDGHPVDVLPDHARGASPDPEAVERHLDGCESCRLELEILMALRSSGPAPMSDIERESTYRRIRACRAAPAGALPGGRTGSSPWLATLWRAAAGIALLLTSVAVWQLVRSGPRTTEWDPDAALVGWAEDLEEFDLGAGDVRLALGLGSLDDLNGGLAWEELGGGDAADLVTPWEVER
jgi:hypothetical protein